MKLKQLFFSRLSPLVDYGVIFSLLGFKNSYHAYFAMEVPTGEKWMEWPLEIFKKLINIK